MRPDAPDLRPFDLGRWERALTSPRQRLHICPACHTTEEEVLETEFAGCPLCYVVFAEAIARIVE